MATKVAKPALANPRARRPGAARCPGRYPDPMDLYARVNILDGKAVRLPHGNVSEAIALDADPIARADGWAVKGVDLLHIVDLNAAAYGDYRNRDQICDIIKSVDVRVQVAGGIRTPAQASRLIDEGAWRVVMGTAAIENQQMVWDLCRDYPGKVVVSLDVGPDEELFIRGWTAHSGRFLEEVLIEMSSAGAAAFFVTEANRNALTTPPNFGVLQTALELADEPVIASGGVRHLADLEELRNLTVGGKRLGGVVVGREVTEGRFTVEEAKELLGAA